jgi:hypothetical protein
MEDYQTLIDFITDLIKKSHENANLTTKEIIRQSRLYSLRVRVYIYMIGDHPIPPEVNRIINTLGY